MDLASGIGLLVVGGAGLTQLIGLVRWAVETYLARRDMRAAASAAAAPRLPEMLRNFNEIYAGLDTLCDDHGALRTVLLKASNGGGVPRVGTPLYVTAVAEAGHGYKITPSWTQRLADDAYIKTLVHLVDKNNIQITVSDMEQGDLRDSYGAAGTQVADLIEVTHNRKELYWLSMHFVDEVPDTPEYRVTRATVVAKLKLLLDSESKTSD